MQRVKGGDTRQAAHDILRRCADNDLSQRDFALRAGIEPATLTRMIHGMRPTTSTLAALVHAWDDDLDAVGVLCAHLRDEIARAEVPEGTIHVRSATDNGQDSDAVLRAALAELRRYSQQDSVRQLILDLATVLRAAAHSDARLAADHRPEYRVEKKGGKA